MVSLPRATIGEEKTAAAGAKLADRTAMMAENLIVYRRGR